MAVCSRFAYMTISIELLSFGLIEIILVDIERLLNIRFTNGISQIFPLIKHGCTDFILYKNGILFKLVRSNFWVFHLTWYHLNYYGFLALFFSLYEVTKYFLHLLVTICLYNLVLTGVVLQLSFVWWLHFLFFHFLISHCIYHVKVWVRFLIKIISQVLFLRFYYILFIYLKVFDLHQLISL